MKPRSFMLALAVSLAGPASAWADPAAEALEALRQQVQQLTQTVQQLSTTVQVQQQHIAELEQARPQARAQTAAAPVSLGQVSAAGLGSFTPEIGVVADIVGQASESSLDEKGNDRLSAREVELVFGHPIDPYSRLDVTASFSDGEASTLEEAYITHWGLPAELKARIGLMHPKVGKAGAMHRDSLDTVDEPLVVAQYLGAEGLTRAGVELSGFLPLPWDVVTHELTVGAMEGGVGEGGTLFGEVRRRPSYYAHLKNFVELSDDTNLELGATYLTGSRDDDSDLEVHALGLDATFVHYVTPTNKLKWQSEAYLQHRDESFTADKTTGKVTEFHNNPLGFYSLLDYRLSPRFGVGGRFDYVQPVDVNPAFLARDADTAYAAYLTFYQSEFARWRLQWRHTDFAQGGDDHTVFLQGTVAIGVHKHALQ